MYKDDENDEVYIQIRHSPRYYNAQSENTVETKRRNYTYSKLSEQRTYGVQRTQTSRQDRLTYTDLVTAAAG